MKLNINRPYKRTISKIVHYRVYFLFAPSTIIYLKECLVLLIRNKSRQIKLEDDT